MKQVFFLAKVNEDMSLSLLPTHYASYQEAEAEIPNLPKGRYQVQKFFEVE